jgi:hypothetical protein
VDEGGAGAGAAGAADAVELDDPLEPDLLELPEPLLVAAPPLELFPAAAAVAALSIPPCPLHDPRPPCGEVVPSLQVTGVAPCEGLLVSANTLPPGSISNTADARPQIKEAYFRILIGTPLLS